MSGLIETVVVCVATPSYIWPYRDSAGTDWLAVRCLALQRQWWDWLAILTDVWPYRTGAGTGWLPCQMSGLIEIVLGLVGYPVRCLA